MTVGHTEERISKIQQESAHWYKARRSFTIKDAASLIGSIEFVSQWVPWLRYLFFALRCSTITALRANRTKVYEDHNMSHFLSDLTLPSLSEINILKKNDANSIISKKIWALQTRFYINKTMRDELNFLSYIFIKKKKYLEMPIAHIIHRDSEFSAHGDACLHGAGGFSDELKFWFFLIWPDDIQKRTVKFKRATKLATDAIISINMLEYATIIILFAAATQKVYSNEIQTLQPYPSIKIFSDNISALSWTKKRLSPLQPIKLYVGCFPPICLITD